MREWTGFEAGILIKIQLTNNFNIITMTKLLDADWFIGVQLFHYAYSSRINDFQKNGTAPEELKEKVLDEIRRKAPNFSSKRIWC